MWVGSKELVWGPLNFDQLASGQTGEKVQIEAPWQGLPDTECLFPNHCANLPFWRKGKIRMIE